MRRATPQSLKRIVSGFTAKSSRPATRALAYSGIGLLATGVVAYLFYPRAERGSVQVKGVFDGPEGYAQVVTHSFTFLVPASFRSYFADCMESGTLAHYVIGRKKVEGVRVGTSV